MGAIKAALKQAVNPQAIFKLTAVLVVVNAIAEAVPSFGLFLAKPITTTRSLLGV